MARRTLFTVGHSNRTWAEFVALLKAWQIEEVVDVRTVPKSGAFRRFWKDRMARALPDAGIAYAHLPALGGLRRAAKDSVNAAWRNASFRGYADYMGTDEFWAGMAELDRRRARRRVCVMCAEAVWWRCHRRMIADAEAARGVPVRHVMSETAAPRHELTAFAKVRRRRGAPPVITYPADGSGTNAKRENPRSELRGPSKKRSR
jgi:uncharacterized protein (DUF488 family)